MRRVGKKARGLVSKGVDAFFAVIRGFSVELQFSLPYHGKKSDLIQW